MRTASWPALARRFSAARGFTLLEVLVTAIVASIIFLLLARWVLGLGAVSGANLDTGAAERSAAYVEELLSSDLAAATTCDERGGATVRTLTEDVLELYITSPTPQADAEPATYRVRWHAQGNALTREQARVHPERGDCGERGERYGVRVVADNLAAAGVSGRLFTGYAKGRESGDCVKAATEHDENQFTYTGTGCYATSIAFDIPMLTAGINPSQFKAHGTIRLASQEGSM